MAASSVQNSNCDRSEEEPSMQEASSTSSSQYDDDDSTEVDETIFTNNADFDENEIDKLFKILYEPDLKPYGEAFIYENGRPVFSSLLYPRFHPYPVHHQVFLQQQREQERRRRQILTSAFSRRTIRGYKCPDIKMLFPYPYRVKVVSMVIAFIDKYSSKLMSTENDCAENCVVCMSTYTANEVLRKIRCSHKFHRKCIDEWLVKSCICPVCRTDLTGSGKIVQGTTILYYIWKEGIPESENKCDVESKESESGN